MGARSFAIRAALGSMVLLGAGAELRAQPSDAPLAVELGRARDLVTVSYDVTNAFTEAFRRRFIGGITSRARIRTLFIDAAGNELGRVERRCEMRFDVWDEVVLLRVVDGDDDTRRVVRLLDAALRGCGVVEDLPTLPRAALPERGFRVLVEVALNPVSEELLEKTREFMSNPSGTSSERVSFFGAIARLFRTDRSAQGESFLFRSAPLSAPEAP